MIDGDMAVMMQQRFLISALTDAIGNEDFYHYYYSIIPLVIQSIFDNASILHHDEEDVSPIIQKTNVFHGTDKGLSTDLYQFCF